MRRRPVPGPFLAAAVGSMFILAGCGTSSPPRPSTTSAASSAPRPPGGRLTVAPDIGHPGSTIRFLLTAPAVSGRHGQTELSYALSVAGMQRSGCVARHAAPIPVSHAGQPVSLPVGPAQLGGRWCPGTYTARVDELARPVCAPTQACPQFIRVVAVLGPARFRIVA